MYRRRFPKALTALDLTWRQMFSLKNVYFIKKTVKFKHHETEILITLIFAISLLNAMQVAKRLTKCKTILCHGHANERHVPCFAFAILNAGILNFRPLILSSRNARQRTVWFSLVLGSIQREISKRHQHLTMCFCAFETILRGYFLQ